MGLTIEREQFDQADVLGFERRLDESLLALERLLRRPGFGTGPPTVGAELELFLVDSGGRALPINQAVRAEAADPRVVLEVDRFNLELNLRRRWPAGPSPRSRPNSTRRSASCGAPPPGTAAGS